LKAKLLFTLAKNGYASLSPNIPTLRQLFRVAADVSEAAEAIESGGLREASTQETSVQDN